MVGGLEACPGSLSDYVRCPPDGGALGLRSDLVSLTIFFFFAVIGLVVLARFYRVSLRHPTAALAYLAAGITYELFPIAGIIVALNFEPKGQELLFHENNAFLVAAGIFFLMAAAFAALGGLAERLAESRHAREQA